MLAEDLRASGLRIVVIGPVPIFDFEDKRGCDVNDIDSCSIPRERLAKQISSVMTQLDSIAQKHDNLFIFDAFSDLCASNATHCVPSKNGAFLFRDADHLNSLGAQSLARSFVELLRENGILEYAE